MDTSTLIIIAAVVLASLVIGVVLWSRSRAEDVVDDIARQRVTRPKSILGSAIRRALGSDLDETTWGALEEALLTGDMGVGAATEIVESVRSSRPATVDEAKEGLASAIRAEMGSRDRGLHLDGTPSVVLVVGVNGTGKTTTIAKLAHHLLDGGVRVTLGAADTFRAAAVEQLQSWGRRLDVRVVRGQEGGDPASVAHDAIESARAHDVGVVIIDTAGRLHAKKNLMAELQKIHRVSGGDSVDEVLLVLDATAGQNGLAQVREFSEAVPISGIVLTKMDGTARGGIVVAVERTLGVPVKFVGTGESLDDLEVFDPDSFVASLLA